MHKIATVVIYMKLNVFKTYTTKTYKILLKKKKSFIAEKNLNAKQVHYH